MKILMLNPYMPYPPSSGGQVRSYNLIKHLSKRHEIHLLALIKNDSEMKYKKELMKYCKQIYMCKRSETPWTLSNIMKSVFGRYPLLVNRNYSQEARDTIKRLLQTEKFDLIHAETFYIMPHIPKTEIPIFLVEQTIEYRVFQHFVKNQIKLPFLRPLFWPDIFKLKYWEKTFWQKADLVGAVSEADEEQMKRLLPDLETTIIPNAAGEDLLDIYETRTKKMKPVFLYIGNYSWLQNVEGAEILIHEIFPRIKKRIPNATCIIAGQRAYEKIGKNAGDGIQIIDISSSDMKAVHDAYAQSYIFLAPLEGPGGTRLKVLAAMATGMPVISSPTGVSGLDVIHKETAYIAHNPEEYAEYAEYLLNHPSDYLNIRKKARKLVDELYSWNSVAQKLEKIYLDLTSRRS